MRSSKKERISKMNKTNSKNEQITLLDILIAGFLLFVCVLLFSGVVAQPLGLTINQTSQIGVSEWASLVSATDSQLVQVKWKEKYGSHHTAYVKAVFESTSHYKMICPEFTIILTKGNITSFVYIIVDNVSDTF